MTKWDFISKYQVPLWMLTIVLVLAFCIIFAERLLQLSGAIAGLFSGVFKGAKKKQISASIRSSVLRASKAVGITDDAILPSDLKIKWADNDDLKSFFDDGCVVVRLRNNLNPNENYVNVIYQFVTNGLLQYQKHYFDESIMQASDLYLTQKIMSSAKISATKYFMDEYYTPVTQNAPSVKGDYDELCAIDDNGMLVNVYFKELSRASLAMGGRIPDPCLTAESGEFLRFLHRITTRGHDEDMELNFLREYFQLGIVLAVSDKTLNTKGWGAHFGYIKRLLDDGIKTVYVFGIGRKARIASKIAYAIKDDDDRIAKTVTHRYKHYSPRNGRRIDAVCVQLDTY